MRVFSHRTLHGKFEGEVITDLRAHETPLPPLAVSTYGYRIMSGSLRLRQTFTGLHVKVAA